MSDGRQVCEDFEKVEIGMKGEIVMIRLTMATEYAAMLCYDTLQSGLESGELILIAQVTKPDERQENG